jgi:DNA-binding transcriptional MerR regulator
MPMGRGATAELIKPEQRTRPRNGRRPALAREASELRRILRTFDDLIKIASSETAKQAERVEEVAWDHVHRAEPIRVLHAAQLLGVSDHTVSEWADRGILAEQDQGPRRVSLESVLRAKIVADDLREAGRDRDLISAVMNRLELGELMEDDRFAKSLEQMRRGERGEWPERWAEKV